MHIVMGQRHQRVQFGIVSAETAVGEIEGCDRQPADETITAIVCIDLESVGHWAEVRGIAYISYSDLSQKPEVRELVVNEIRRVNRVLPEPLRIMRFVDLHKEFDPDDGEITRTRKLRRNVIEERYKAVIDALYSSAESVVMKAQITYDSGDIGVIERNLVVGNV